jgi:hypothetical protein
MSAFVLVSYVGPLLCSQEYVRTWLTFNSIYCLREGRLHLDFTVWAPLQSIVPKFKNNIPGSLQIIYN